MSIFKMVETKAGPRFFKDKMFIAKKNIPTNVFERLTVDNPVDDAELPASTPVRECLFCGAIATRRRLINLQTIALCDEHYFNRTTGEVVAKLRETADEDQAAGQQP